MNKDATISVFETVGSPFCVASSDGQKVYDRLFKAMKQGTSVTLSFRNVSILTAAFLNAAIGQLYGEFNNSQIRNLLFVKDIDTDDLYLLKRVVETAKQYFKNPQRFDEVVAGELGSEEENG